MAPRYPQYFCGIVLAPAPPPPILRDESCWRYSPVLSHARRGPGSRRLLPAFAGTAWYYTAETAFETLRPRRRVAGLRTRRALLMQLATRKTFSAVLGGRSPESPSGLLPPPEAAARRFNSRLIPAHVCCEVLVSLRQVGSAICRAPAAPGPTSPRPRR